MHPKGLLPDENVTDRIDRAVQILLCNAEDDGKVAWGLEHLPDGEALLRYRAEQSGNGPELFEDADSDAVHRRHAVLYADIAGADSFPISLMICSRSLPGAEAETITRIAPIPVRMYSKLILCRIRIDSTFCQILSRRSLRTADSKLQLH